MKHPNIEAFRGDLLDWAAYWLTRFAPIYFDAPKGETEEITIAIRWPKVSG